MHHRRVRYRLCLAAVLVGALCQYFVNEKGDSMPANPLVRMASPTYLVAFQSFHGEADKVRLRDYYVQDGEKARQKGPLL